jgi:NAD(P)-dependent dehydrogenase (short-subunit alcohol dehydrogenase family)
MTYYYEIIFILIFQAALNAVTRSLSIDLKNDGVMVISLHPGWVQTDMGGKQAPLKVEQSVSRILDTLMKLEDKHNGTFLQYDGSSLPW